MTSCKKYKVDNNATQLSITEPSSFNIVITLLQSQILRYIAKNHAENSNLRKRQLVLQTD